MNPRDDQNGPVQPYEKEQISPQNVLEMALFKHILKVSQNPTE